MSETLINVLMRQWPRLLLYSGLILVVFWIFPNYMRGLLYQPPHFPVPPPPPGMKDIRLPLHDGAHASAWLMPAKTGAAGPTTPVILFFHGNAENLGTLEAAGLFKDFARVDADLMALDYPGYGNSGGKPSEASIREAACRAMDFLILTKPEAPIIVAGWSLGAAAAVETAHLYSDRVSGLILYSPWSSLDDLARHHYPGLLVSLILRESYPTEANARGLQIPALVFHGERDTIIPVSQGERVARALPQGKWIPIPSADHVNVMSAPETWVELKAFFDTFAPPEAQ